MDDRQENPVPGQPAAPPPRHSAPWLASYRWKAGQSGNPSGRPRESGSLAAALRRVGLKSVQSRATVTRLAEQLGLDPNETANIDVIAGLIYDAIMQLLVRTVRGQGGAGDRLVGMLQVLARSLDGDRSEITLNAPLELDAALANVSAALGLRARVGPFGSEFSDTEDEPEQIDTPEPKAAIDTAPQAPPAIDTAPAPKAE
ncbi:MAG: DUF5681 domain-containing protein [Phycisphaerae bacterium]